jgi:hypothetical protein
MFYQIGSMGAAEHCWHIGKALASPVIARPGRVRAVGLPDPAKGILRAPRAARPHTKFRPERTLPGRNV